MTKKELINKLTFVNDDAIIYVEADHGQHQEQADNVFLAFVNEKSYYLPDADWVNIADSTEDFIKTANVVCIGY